MECIFKKSPIIAVLIFIISLANLVGCQNDNSEIGSYHIAVLSVTDWDTYKTELQPNFQITGDAALEKVIPDTLLLESAIYDSLRVKADVKFGSKIKTATTDETDDTDEKKETGLPEYKSRINPNQKQVTKTEKLGQDAGLAYLAATALFQEVKLLNRYIQDANIPHEYKPYIVRLQISQMPLARKQPLDLYINIGFFLNNMNNLTAVHGGEATKEPSEPKISPSFRLPIVVPLLATDQIEGALESRQMEKLRQLILSLSAAYAGIGGSLDLEALNEKLQRSVGKSHNSLFTIGQITHNIIRVRLGARQIPNEEGGESFEAIPRTHNISLLVLVPLEKDVASNTPVEVSIGSRRLYRNAVTGKSIKCSSNAKSLKTIKDEFWKDFGQEWLSIGGGYYYKHFVKEQKNLLYTAALCAQNGEYKQYLKVAQQAFGKKVLETPENLGMLDFLWLELNSMGILSPYDVTQFTVYPYLAVAQETTIKDDAFATLIDNGKDTVATVYRVKGDILKNLSAEWTFYANNETVTFAAYSMKLNGNNLILTFPSASLYGLTPESLKNSTLIPSSSEKSPIISSEKSLTISYSENKSREVKLPWVYKSIQKETKKDSSKPTTQPSKVVDMAMEVNIKATGKDSANNKTSKD